MADLPPFLQGRRGAADARLSSLLDRAGRLEHQLRDVLAQVIEHVDDDDDLACECRRFMADLDR
jgi:thioredoxin-like negative regulator of GroEL